MTFFTIKNTSTAASSNQLRIKSITINLEGSNSTEPEYVDTHVNPYLVGGDSQLTAGALASEVAHMINPAVKDLSHWLPTLS